MCARVLVNVVLPAVLPSLTCSAERGTSQRNLNGSWSPWEWAERGTFCQTHKWSNDSFAKCTNKAESRTAERLTIFFLSLLLSLQTRITAFLNTGEGKEMSAHHDDEAGIPTELCYCGSFTPERSLHKTVAWAVFNTIQKLKSSTSTINGQNIKKESKFKKSGIVGNLQWCKRTKTPGDASVLNHTTLWLMIFL